MTIEIETKMGLYQRKTVKEILNHDDLRSFLFNP
jgi:hypothetical protein